MIATGSITLQQLPQKKLKIAIIALNYGRVGGGEKFIYEFTERLAAHRLYEVHVFTKQWSHQSRNIQYHKIPVIIFPRFLKVISFAWFAAKKTNK